MTWELTDKFGEMNRSPTRHEWNALGYKKLEDEVISGERRSEPAAIWFNKTANDFAAHFLGILFEAATYRELIDQLTSHLRKSEDVPFERFIKIDYDRKHESRRLGVNGKQMGGDDDERPVCGFRFEFDVLDISPAFLAQRRKGKERVRTSRRMELVDGEWKVADEDTYRADYYEENELVPFTEERYRTLVDIKQAVADLDARLHAVLGEGADRAGLLDRVAASRLLAMPILVRQPKSLPAPTTRRRKR